MKFLLLKTSPVKRQAAAATTTMEAYQGGFKTTPLSLITVKVAAADRVSVTYGFVPEMQIRFMESKPAKTL
jgi:hypothetical protein